MSSVPSVHTILHLVPERARSHTVDGMRSDADAPEMVASDFSRVGGVDVDPERHRCGAVIDRVTGSVDTAHAERPICATGDREQLLDGRVDQIIGHHGTNAM